MGGWKGNRVWVEWVAGGEGVECGWRGKGGEGVGWGWSGGE